MLWRGGKISYRIIWVLVFSMIVFTVGMWALFSLAYRYAIKGVINEYVFSAASELATEIRLTVKADVEVMESFAASDAFRGMDPPEVSMGLARLVLKDPSAFLSAYVLDDNGNAVAYDSQSRGISYGPSKAPLSRSVFESVLNGQTYISGWNPGSEPGEFYPRPFWVIAVPIELYAGKTAGVLVGLADLSRIEDLVMKKRLGETGMAYLVDKQGTVLVHVNRSLIGKSRLSEPAVKAVTENESGVMISTVGGVRMVAAHAALPDIGWGVLVRMEEQEVLAGYRRLTIDVIMASVLFLVVLSGISILKINRILAPLSTLQSAVDKVGSGDYNTQVNVSSSDEIGSLADAFNDMVGKVRDAERAKTEFVSLLSHELRTPLTSIKGYASTLLRRDVVWDEDSKREFIETINSEADRLGRLVSDMLDVSRIDLGRLEIRIGSIAAADLAKQVARRVATVTDTHQFVFEVAPDTPDAKGDKDRVEQILHNLYSNAIKYAPGGGIIKTSVAFDPSNRMVVVAVSDQGIGIPGDKIESIFDRFYRIHDSRMPETGGTGLGLYITKHLVTAMGGTIVVDSVPGQGSTFTFTLPSVGFEKEASA